MAGNDKRIVLDANILIRAVLGNKVRSLISQYADDVQFYTPSVCYEDALKYIPSLMERRNLPSEDALKVLESLISFINIINKSLYGDFADVSLQRIGRRDPDDW